MSASCHVVRASVTPLFATPDSHGEVETECLLGERFDIEDEVEGWCRGQLLTDGYSGWVSSAALCECDDWAPTHRLCVPLTIVTRQPSIKSPVVARLSLGSLLSLRHDAAVAATGRDDGIAVWLPGAAQPGYLPRTHVRPLAQRDQDWVATAEALGGSPYSWGGRSATGLDCSALVQLAAQGGGINMPRNSSQQQNCGQAIASAEPLQRGDLIFWRGHVGIMQDSEQLLHANAHHMQVASEPLAQAAARIASVSGAATTATGAGDVTARRRLQQQPGSD